MKSSTQYFLLSYCLLILIELFNPYIAKIFYPLHSGLPIVDPLLNLIFYISLNYFQFAVSDKVYESMIQVNSMLLAASLVALFYIYRRAEVEHKIYLNNYRKLIKITERLLLTIKSLFEEVDRDGEENNKKLDQIVNQNIKKKVIFDDIPVRDVGEFYDQATKVLETSKKLMNN